MTLNSEVLKQDARGRVRVSAERRQALLEEFEKSGSSAAGFARLAGIKYATFAGWVQDHRRRIKPGGGSGSEKSTACPLPAATNISGGAPAAAAAANGGGVIRLLEAVVEEEGGNRSQAQQPLSSAQGLLIELPGGSRMVIESPAQMQMAAELVALIAQRIPQRTRSTSASARC